MHKEITLDGKAEKIGSFNRNGLEQTLKGLHCFADGAKALRYAGQERKEDREFEGWEITAECLEELLTSDKKCRIILDYDPAERHIIVYRQLISETTQP